MCTADVICELFGSFDPGRDVVMYGSSSLGVYDDGCVSMTGKNGRLLAR